MSDIFDEYLVSNITSWLSLVVPALLFVAIVFRDVKKERARSWGSFLPTMLGHLLFVIGVFILVNVFTAAGLTARVQHCESHGEILGCEAGTMMMAYPVISGLIAIGLTLVGIIGLTGAKILMAFRK